MKTSLHEKIYGTAFDLLTDYRDDNIIINPELIIDCVNRAIKLYGKKFQFASRVVIELQEAFTVNVSNSNSLTDLNKDHKPWYFDQQKENRPHWESYRKFLLKNKRYTVNGVASLNETTDKILGFLENPKREGSWDVRGLVVGSVQSGKTSNFIGLINKAVDAGYKGIIILSGLHNNLRKQTQDRIDDGLLGYDTRLYDDTDTFDAKVLDGYRRKMNPNLPKIISLTYADHAGDFSTEAKKRNKLILEGNPTVIVAKKNKTILEQIIKHFCEAPGMAKGIKHIKNKPFKIIAEQTGSFIKNYPILVIDDETDNASVDTGDQTYYDDENPDPNYEPKTINRLIRQLLHIFEKKAYVGYTATPYANIFIHDKGRTTTHGPDLFPKNFVIDLPIPENHTGLEKLFPPELLEEGEIYDDELENISQFKLVKDSSVWLPPQHKKDHIPCTGIEGQKLPRSLRRAILSFLITSLVRNMRGEIHAHKTMLIHVSRLTKVQKEIQKQVQDEIEELRDILNQNIPSEKKSLIDELEQIYDEDFLSISNEHPEKVWPKAEQIFDDKHLKMIINQVGDNVKCLNRETEKGQDLDYEEYKRTHSGAGIATIVIGGDKLSRGLTLEGLSISYFLRSARHPMYDTLMQMGRWFGYRKEYIDLCKIYTTSSIIGWFFKISAATKKFRDLLHVMSIQNKTPTEFGLYVQDDPILSITSKTKMRHSFEKETSFSGSEHQYTQLVRNQEILKENEKLVHSFLEKCGKPFADGSLKNGFQNYKNTYQWRNVPTKIGIDFLKKFKVFPSEKSFPTSDLIEYILKVGRQGELKNFCITLVGNGNGKGDKLFNKYNINYTIRQERGKDLKDKIHVQTITSDTLIGTDLTDEEFKQFKELEKSYNKNKRPKDPNFSKRYGIRQVRSPDRVALNIYPIEAYHKDPLTNKEIKVKVLTCSLDFPDSKLERHKTRIKYRVNTIYSREQQANLN